MSHPPTKNWGRTALISGATACWLMFDMATASEAPSRAVLILEYVLLGMALIGVTGSAVMYFKEN